MRETPLFDDLPPLAIPTYSFAEMVGPRGEQVGPTLAVRIIFADRTTCDAALTVDMLSEAVRRGGVFTRARTDEPMNRIVHDMQERGEIRKARAGESLGRAAYVPTGAPIELPDWVELPPKKH